MIKRLIGIIVVVGLLGAALVLSQRRHPPLSVSGFIEADEIRVGSRVGGRVMKVHVVEGQDVKANDLLLELEPFDMNERRAQAAAQLEQAKAQQEHAQVSVNRLKPAFEHQAASKEEMDAAIADVHAAVASVDAATANLAAMDKQIAELKVFAPVPGRVEAVDLQPGDLVAANAPVLSIMDTSNLWVRAYLPENHIDVQVGQKVTVTVDSYPDSKYAAHISFIARQAEFTPGNVQTPEERSKQVFRIKVTLDEGLKILHPGMSADVWLNEKR